jgi:hypothetical protein
VPCVILVLRNLAVTCESPIIFQAKFRYTSTKLNSFHFCQMMTSELQSNMPSSNSELNYTSPTYHAPFVNIDTFPSAIFGMSKQKYVSIITGKHYDSWVGSTTGRVFEPLTGSVKTATSNRIAILLSLTLTKLMKDYSDDGKTNKHKKKPTKVYY